MVPVLNRLSPLLLFGLLLPGCAPEQACDGLGCFGTDPDREQPPVQQLGDDDDDQGSAAIFVELDTPGEVIVRAGEELDFAIDIEGEGELMLTAEGLPPGSLLTGEGFYWRPSAENIGAYDVLFLLSTHTHVVATHELAIVVLPGLDLVEDGF